MSGTTTSNAGTNFSGGAKSVSESLPPQYAFLLLTIIPAVTVFGNAMVVAAILTQKSLKMVTNYLLLSLAVADLLVGVLVMPFSIYTAVRWQKWDLPRLVCKVYMVSDVSCSTASIAHLVAISVDRFYAVVRHLEYRSPTHQRRIFITIAFVWLFSIGLGLPLGIGLNEPILNFCSIANADFMLYGSLFSFYIPCLLMAVMYGFVFYRLHKQLQAVTMQETASGKSRNSGRNLNSIVRQSQGNVRDSFFQLAVPVLGRRGEADSGLELDSESYAQEMEELEQMLEEIEHDDENGIENPGPNGRRKLMQSESENSFSRYPQGPPRLRKSTTMLRLRTMRKTAKDRATDMVMRMRSKQGMAVRKETRATKLVATVMVVFLICWLPFFTVNLIVCYKLRYDVASVTPFWDSAFVVCSWLGYLNSSLNPIIYTLINNRFRQAFARLLRCSQSQPKKTNRLRAPPPTAESALRRSTLRSSMFPPTLSGIQRNSLKPDSSEFLRRLSALSRNSAPSKLVRRTTEEGKHNNGADVRL